MQGKPALVGERGAKTGMQVKSGCGAPRVADSVFQARAHGGSIKALNSLLAQYFVDIWLSLRYAARGHEHNLTFT